MNKNELLDLFLEDPELLGEVVEEIVAQWKVILQQEQSNDTKQQLLEVSKAITRLEKTHTTVRPELITLQSNLLYEQSKLDEYKAKYEKLMNVIISVNNRSGTAKQIRSKLPRTRRTETDYFWNREQLQDQDSSIENELSQTIDSDRITDFRFMKVMRVYVIDTWYPTSNWRDVKKNVYNCIITERPEVVLKGVLEYSKDASRFRTPINLINGYYTEGNRSASAIVKECRESLKIAGFSPFEHFHLEIDMKS